MSSSTWKRNSVSEISIPARNAPSTRERPARPVTKASSRVTSSTFRTNSSFERRRATIPSQARISFGPRVITTASASTALPRAMATAAPSASADWSSAGSSTSRGTTARSWNSSMPMTWRPCAVSSSSRSASSLETIAVEDIAAMPPRASPACHEAPAASAAATASAIVAATWARPSPNTARRMARSFGKLNSSPIENIRNTTPNCASRRVSSMSETSPSACGPKARPLTR